MLLVCTKHVKIKKNNYSLKLESFINILRRSRCFQSYQLLPHHLLKCFMSVLWVVRTFSCPLLTYNLTRTYLLSFAMFQSQYLQSNTESILNIVSKSNYVPVGLLLEFCIDYKNDSNTLSAAIASAQHHYKIYFSLPYSQKESITMK